MAALTQTPANVGIGSTAARTRAVVGGEAITQGMPVYFNSTNNKYYRADNNLSATAANAVGIAMTPCTGDNQAFVIQEGAGVTVNLGATLVVGETYCVGSTAGQIVPIGDLTSGNFPCILGVATTTALMQTLYAFTGIAKA